MKKISTRDVGTKIGPDLSKIIAENLGYDVATAYASILGPGENKVERLSAAAGEKILLKHEEFFRNLVRSGAEYEGLKEIYDLIKKALGKTLTYEELMSTPMHEEVKNIKAKRD